MIANLPGLVQVLYEALETTPYRIIWIQPNFGYRKKLQQSKRSVDIYPNISPELDTRLHR